MTVSRLSRLTTILAPWVSLPPALYVAALPLLRPGRDYAFLALVGLAGAAAVAVPAAALRWLERRRPARAVWLLVAVAGLAATSIAAGAQVAWAFAVACCMLAAAYGYGRMLAPWLDLADETGSWQTAPLLATAGWAVLIVLGLASGTLGVLRAPFVVACVLAGVGGAVLSLRRGRDAASLPAEERPGLAWWWGFVLLLLIGLVGATAPEVRYDALAAHLPIAREFARVGAIVEMRQNAASYFQLNGDLLFAMGMTLVPGEAVPKLLHFLAGATACFLTYDLGARLWNARVGLAGAAVAAGTPLVWWVGGAAYTDLWVVLFAVGLAAALERYARRPGPGRALLVGLLAGAALGVKVTASAVVLPGVAAFLLMARRTRADRSLWPDLLALAVGLAATGAYWYLRAWLLTGNPVFPLFNEVFKSPLAGPGGGLPALPVQGTGRSPVDLLLIPWRVTRFPGRFVEDGTLGIVYLILLPATLLAVARRQVPRWLAGVLGASGLIWFVTAQYLRFLLPVLPLAALVGAAGLFAEPRRGPGALSSALVLTVGLALGAGAWIAPALSYFPWQVAARRLSRTAYLEQRVAGFNVADYARRALPASARIYGAGEDKAYYYDRFFVPLSWYGRLFGRDLRDAVLAAESGQEVRTVLTRAGFTHLVVYPQYPLIVRWRRPGGWLAREAFGEDGPRLEYADGGYYLFDLR